MTPAAMSAFLDTLASGASVSAAAAVAGVSSTTVYAHRKADADFAESWRIALEDSADLLESEARRRAVEGVEEPVWHQGVKVGRVRKYSDSLMTVLLKGRRKSVFADRTELTGAEGAPVALDDHSRAARAAQLIAIAQARQAAAKAAQDLDAALHEFA